MILSEMNRIRKVVDETLEKLGVADEVIIQIEWNNRFTRRMGDARIIADGRKPGFDKTIGKVRFSNPLWPRASEQERTETAIHEVCHIVKNHIYGRLTGAHGRYWQHLMYKCGINPDRTHTVDRTGLKRSHDKVACKCDCNDNREIGFIRARRIRNGQSQYTCVSCNSIISLKEKESGKVVGVDSIWR